MKLCKFNAFCKYEIGDKIIHHLGPDKESEITDIAMIYFSKSNKTEFLYELDGSGKYKKIIGG